MLVLMLMLMFMSHASVDLFVLSFVLPCAYQACSWLSISRGALQKNLAKARFLS